ncbi:MAG: hypothetical protein MK110_09010 [Fuerstiella sp.]|nr:hypothetical protein [Fuerstiella sp.]
MSDKQYTHQSNATHLELALRRAKPWFEANATFLIYGLAAVLAVAAVVVWFGRQPEANTGVSTLLMDASSPEDFQDIADQYDGTPLGILARLKQAEERLQSAFRKMFTDRAAANIELADAEVALGRLGDLKQLDSIVRQRVLLGLARLAEIRCDGTADSLQSAANAWQNVLDQEGVSIAADYAEGRMEAMKDPATATFYAWFHGLDPKPADDLDVPAFSGGSSFGPGTPVPAVPNEGTGSLPDLSLPVLDEIGIDESAEASGTDSDSSQQPSGDDVDAPEPAAEQPVEPDTETGE